MSCINASHSSMLAHRIKNGGIIMQISIKLHYIVFGTITFIASLIGRFFASSGRQWYYTLSLPSYTPADWFIGVVWTVIYVLTTIAAILVYGRFERNSRFWLIIALFCCNLLCNIAWPYFFFYKHAIGLAFFDAIALFFSVLALIVLIGQQSLLIASLLAPYLGWVAFACWLNLIIWFHN